MAAFIISADDVDTSMLLCKAKRQYLPFGFARQNSPVTVVPVFISTLYNVYTALQLQKAVSDTALCQHNHTDI